MFHVVLEHQEPSAKSGPFHGEVHYDPAFPDAPKQVPIDEFVLAWIDADQFMRSYDWLE